MTFGNVFQLLLLLLLLLLFILSLAVKNYNWTCQPITASHKRKQPNIYTLIYHYNIGTHLE
jgi:putative copper export protein